MKVRAKEGSSADPSFELKWGRVAQFFGEERYGSI